MSIRFVKPAPSSTLLTVIIVDVPWPPHRVDPEELHRVVAVIGTLRVRTQAAVTSPGRC
jgi:hypothetical protein